MPGDDTSNSDSTEDTAGVSTEVWNELAEFPGAIDGSTFDEFVSADDDVPIMGQIQDEDYIADVVPTTSQSDSSMEIDDGPLPTSSEVISALALVRRYCLNVEGCRLSCFDSLDNLEAWVLSQAAKLLTHKKIRDICSTVGHARVMSLVSDMHQCAATVAECFSAPSGNGSEGEGGEGCASPTASPARLCYVVGQALRECAVAAAKLLLLCGVFSRHKHLLSREERQDLIKHCVSRLPTFMNQLQKLLEAVKRTFGNLSFAERTVIAAYVVPEIESSLESLFQLIAEAKRALDLIISRMTNDKMTTEPYVADLPVGELLNRNLRNSLNVRELVKLRSFYEKVFMTFITLMRKK
ncbi:hypothetical protein HPB51_008522 [Rhipicephalus microplus]|uniref:Uncharacterized protein n=1 Tax=Rhipicephalus microplus TaxID=6941 RepID=A0A9J6ERS1_RHIMP|nr:hypothetical protein HPB51_008522 [Rhipicephalus microplus]